MPQATAASNTAPGKRIKVLWFFLSRKNFFFVRKKQRTLASFGLHCPAGAAWAAGLAVQAGVTSAAAADPYAALRIYNGTWLVTTGAGAPTHLTNHCACTGLFYACEQVVNGATTALVVFLPTGATATGQTYLTQPLRVPAATPPPWGPLTINGANWVYGAPDARPAKPGLDRTLNHVIDNGHIHFQVQHASAALKWVTIIEGDERRAP